jgi:glycosyltransferase involved in cell wall biosynthesis
MLDHSTAMLAVFTPHLGSSFINFHMERVLPGRTVAVARYQDIDSQYTWKDSCPVFYLDRWALRPSVRLARRMGIPHATLRDVAMKRFLLRHGVTVALVEFLDEFLDFVPLLVRMGIPYVVQGHGIDVSASLRQPGVAERYLAYKSARAILTRSEFHRQRLINLGLPAEKIHLNVGGVEIPAAPPVRPPSASKRFLAVSRMVPKKGSIYLLEAFRLAAARDPEISLDIVGKGPLYPAAQQFVHACGLSERVHLHGASQEVRDRMMTQCGVFVQHSITDPETGDEEGLPAAIQEAMAQAMAVVSTRHTGIREAVIEGETGLLADEGNVQEMADDFLRVTSCATVFGEAGYRRAAAQFSWEAERERLRGWMGLHGEPAVTGKT